MSLSAASNRKFYVVTGGGGFVGKAIALRLVKDGHRVLSLARGAYPDLRQLGVETQRVDLSSPEVNLETYIAGAEAIFHVAAKVEMWGRYDEFYAANVLATEKLILAARRAGVRKFIYTSSPSVVADGTNLRNIDESYSYPKHFEAHYPQTKAMAEKLVLAANSESFYTLALRPHLIFGPGDQSLVPTILERARAGRLLQVGKGQNLVDVCFIGDCVEAHIKACTALDANIESRGRAYFISQGQPVNLWDWIAAILLYNGLPRPSKILPVPLCLAIAGLCEATVRFLPFLGEPLLTKFLVREMATDHFFDISAAKALLGFSPSCSVEVAMERTFVRPS